MNKKFTQTALLILCLFALSTIKLNANTPVDPKAPNVNLFCKGSDMTLPAPPAGEDWIVRYSATQTTTPSTPVTLNNNTILAASLETGYYYLSSKSTAVGSCESAMQEIPVYVLNPLVVVIEPANFCVEATPLAQIGQVTNPESTVISSLAYQWYTVDASNVEQAIVGATLKDYTPTGILVAGTTTYRLRAGYLIGTNKYCPTTSADKAVVITPKPTAPIITPTLITGTASAVTF